MSASTLPMDRMVAGMGSSERVLFSLLRLREEDLPLPNTLDEQPTEPCRS